MGDESKSISPINYMLQPGFIYVSTEPVEISAVVGSCVSVCVYDKNRKTGGMNLFKKPKTKDKKNATAVYGNASVVALLNIMIKDGSKSEDLEAQIFGGAYNTKYSKENIGEKNVRVARKILKKNKVRIVSEDVGGEKGRKIIFNTFSNEIAVMKVENLRSEDWFPYARSA